MDEVKPDVVSKKTEKKQPRRKTTPNVESPPRQILPPAKPQVSPYGAVGDNRSTPTSSASHQILPHAKPRVSIYGAVGDNRTPPRAPAQPPILKPRRRETIPLTCEERRGNKKKPVERLAEDLISSGIWRQFHRATARRSTRVCLWAWVSLTITMAAARCGLVRLT